MLDSDCKNHNLHDHVYNNPKDPRFSMTLCHCLIKEKQFKHY